MLTILTIAIPCPLRLCFDYLANDSDIKWQKGLRVTVPFGSRTVVGIVCSVKQQTELTSKLKTIISCIETTPLLSEEFMSLTHWISDYYHHPLGNCFQSILPKKIRLGESADFDTETVWLFENKAEQALGKNQQKIIDLFSTAESTLSQKEIYTQLGACRASLLSLEKKGLLKQRQEIKIPTVSKNLKPACQLNDEQQIAVDNIWQSHLNFNVHLLQGITGSGKTEVYIQLCEQIIAENKQVLILIPEISLATQFVQRFKQQLSARIGVYNSSISDTERKQTWLLANAGLLDIVIGTRSAVFIPFKKMGLIIIDEEHDASYKQQEGLRYHARNIALLRAHRSTIPIVLGSATPSLESLYKVQQQRYKRLKLNKRAGGAKSPKVSLIDIAGPSVESGLSTELYHAIQQQITAGNQVLIFINRRGFAPVLMCHECGWQAKCRQCDAKLTVHQYANTLTCHHCGLIHRLLQQCPECKTKDLKTYGVGTEQIEQTLQKLFPEIDVLRIDRDSTQRVNAFADMVADIQKGEAKILVGTQMLAKGHDFHNVTLVGVLDADQGLFSADYRATESLAQLITQVIGRSGRGAKVGEVMIQTNQPNHVFWQDLIKKGYPYIAEKILEERASLMMPPVGNLCVIRGEDKDQSLAMLFLTEVAAILNQQSEKTVFVMGPVPAIMERKAGRYRAQLLLMSPTRKPLHQLLDHHLTAISTLKLARKVRWSIDIDPLDLL